MVIGMMLRFFHEVVTGDPSKFGGFKLRGVTTQFTAAVELYRLFAEHNGNVPENELDWAMHNLLETLLRPEGLGNRPVDCPTDQVVFLWAFLSGGRYRIARHLQSFLAGIKCALRSIEIHSARVQARKQVHGESEEELFYNDLLTEGENPMDEEESDSDDLNGAEPPGPQSNTVPDLAAALQKLKNLKHSGG